jgi:hypothetical protein
MKKNKNMQKDKEEIKKLKEKVYKIAYEDNMRMTKWLYDNHRDILNEYCDKFMGGKRLLFAGG